MLTIPLALHTAVIYVDGDGKESPARIVANITPGVARLALDDDGNHTAQASFSDEAAPGTFHFERSDGEPAKKKPFKPGAKKAETNGASTPAP